MWLCNLYINILTVLKILILKLRNEAKVDGSFELDNILNIETYRSERTATRFCRLNKVRNTVGNTQSPASLSLL